MKNALFAVLACTVSLNAIAAESDKLLSIKHVTIEGTEIALPTTQKADGIVCQAYVSRTYREGGKLVAKIEESCAPRPAPVAVR